MRGNLADIRDSKYEISQLARRESPAISKKRLESRLTLWKTRVARFPRNLTSLNLTQPNLSHCQNYFDTSDTSNLLGINDSERA